jgi:DNA-binding NarL/FixJ family response regulator
MTNNRVRVGVVTSCPLLSLGLTEILEKSLPVQVESLAAESVFAVKGVAEEIAVLILSMSCIKRAHADESGTVDVLLNAIHRLRRRHPRLKIIAIGDALTSDEVQRVIGAGAKGYLLETASESEIKMAVEVVLDGSIWAPRKVLARLIEASAAATVATGSAGDIATEELSAREQEVMNLLMSGRSNREIASALGIEPATVKAHLGRMLRKTRSRNRLEMTLRQMEQMELKAEEKTSDDINPDAS